MEFFKCKHCGNIIAYVQNSGVKVVCCGEEMQKITENTTEQKYFPLIAERINRTAFGNAIKPTVIVEIFVKYLNLLSGLPLRT